MPDRCHETLKRMAWAASRLASISPPSNQPPGNGKLPETTTSRGEKICKGTHTKPVRKYTFTAFHVPRWTCASVPKTTRRMDRANRTTVIRSDPAVSGVRMYSALLRGPGAGGVAAGSGGAAVIAVDDSMKLPFHIVRERYRAHEGVERFLLPRDFVVRSQDHEHPAVIIMGKQDSQHAL